MKHKPLRAFHVVAQERHLEEGYAVELRENDIVQKGVFCYRLSDRKRPLIKASLAFLQ